MQVILVWYIFICLWRLSVKSFRAVKVSKVSQLYFNQTSVTWGISHGIFIFRGYIVWLLIPLIFAFDGFLSVSIQDFLFLEVHSMTVDTFDVFFWGIISRVHPGIFEVQPHLLCQSLSLWPPISVTAPYSVWYIGLGYYLC